MLTITLLLSAGLAQCSETTAAAVTQDSILATATGNPDFSTLVAAVQAAELQHTLAGPGPFTVFAPSNAAFAKLPKGTVEALLMPKNKAMLQGILTNHVVAGKVPASQVISTPGTVAVGGQWLAFTTDKQGAKVDGAWVKTTDIACHNGVIHVIDSVMLPTDSDLVEVAANNGSFSTLLAAAQAAGLAETLKSPGPFTIFAPTDEAFSSLGDSVIASLLLPKNRETLARILKHTRGGWSPVLARGDRIRLCHDACGHSFANCTRRQGRHGRHCWHCGHRCRCQEWCHSCHRYGSHSIYKCVRGTRLIFSPPPAGL